MITGHDAGKLWGMNVQGGHAVTVTGVQHDANGQPSNYITNDTGLGVGARSVQAAQFTGSFLTPTMGVSDNVLQTAPTP